MDHKNNKSVTIRLFSIYNFFYKRTYYWSKVYYPNHRKIDMLIHLNMSYMGAYILYIHYFTPNNFLNTGKDYLNLNLGFEFDWFRIQYN